MLSVYQTIEGSTGDADIGETPPAGSAAAAGGASAAGAGTDSVKRLIWQILTRKYDTRRPQWYYGQATVNAATPHEVGSFPMPSHAQWLALKRLSRSFDALDVYILSSFWEADCGSHHKATAADADLREQRKECHKKGAEGMRSFSVL